MLERMPLAKLEDLKAGETIVVSSTKGAKSNEVTAIMMLANADGILQMIAAQSGGGRARVPGRADAAGGNGRRHGRFRRHGPRRNYAVGSGSIPLPLRSGDRPGGLSYEKPI